MPNKPAPVTNAEAAAWQAVLQNRARRMPVIVEDAEWQQVSRLLADRTRDKERIEKLEEGLRDLKWGDKEHWVDGKLQHIRMTATEMCDKARALLEVPGGK